MIDDTKMSAVVHAKMYKDGAWLILRECEKQSATFPVELNIYLFYFFAMVKTTSW